MNETNSSHPEQHIDRVISLGTEQVPKLHPSVWLAPGAFIVGDVTVGADSSVWYNAVLRGDSDAVQVGERCNFQDGVVVHTQAGDPAIIGDDVSVGHNAVLHGARVEDGCLIGMSATVLSGAVVGAGSLVAAGALVPQGMQIPSASLVAGIPARVIRPLTEQEVKATKLNAKNYLGYTVTHREAVTKMASAVGQGTTET